MRSRKYGSPRTVVTNDLSKYSEYVLQMAVQGDFSRLREADRAELEGVPAAKRAEFLTARFTDRLKSIEAALSDTFGSIDPLTFLALFALVGHTRPSGTTTPENPTGQVHIELAQFLCVKYRTPTAGAEPSLEIYSRMGSLIRAYQQYSSLIRSPSLEPRSTPEDAERRQAAYVTAQTFAVVRNWAYPRSLERVLTDLVTPLEGALIERSGFRAGSVINLWGRIRDVAYRRILIFDQLRMVVDREPENEHEWDDLLVDAESVGLSELVTAGRERGTREARQMAITKRAASLFTFSTEELLAHVDGPASEKSAVTRYLKDYALALGALQDSRLSDALYENPVWAKPAISLGPGSYFICIPSLFHSFPFRHLEDIYRTANLEKRYEIRRARFLENEVQDLIRRALPSAEVFTRSQFHAGGKLLENDTLVKIGNWLLIFEEKSHKVNRPAQRGGADSLQDRIQKLLVEPSDQSARFAAHLATHPSRHEFKRAKGPPNVVDVGECVRILRVTVILESLGSLPAQLGVIHRMGMVHSDYRFAVTMNLLDLAVVMEVLQSEEERLDYLFRRSSIQEGPHIDGEERDYLMFYVAAQLRASWSRTEQGEFLGIAGWHQLLDDFYIAPLEGRPPTRYVRKYTPLWNRIINFIRQEPALYWPEAAMVLLSFTLEEQTKIEKQIRLNSGDRTKAVARRLSMPGWNEKFMVCFKEFSENTIERGIEGMKAEGRRLLEGGGVDHIVIIGLATRGLKPVEVAILTDHSRPRWY